MIDESIKKYIDDEKRLSLFKISALERTKSSYKDRLLNKERSFLDFNFYEINFSSLDECKEAISLFKTNKSLFIKQYSNLKSDNFVEIKILNNIKKLSVNKDDGSIDSFIFPSLSRKEIHLQDGSLRSVFQKRLCYMRLILLFLIKYLKDKKVSYSDLDQSTYFNIFEYFLKNHNKSDFNSLDIDINISEKILDLFLNFFSCYKKDEFFVVAKTKSTNLLVLPIKHSGNEKIRPLFTKIFLKDGRIVVPKGEKFSNYFYKEKYWKCVRIDSGILLKDIDFSKSIMVSTFSRRMIDVILETKLWFGIYIDKLKDI